MSNFDLNINNYKKSELEEIFELPANYDITIVEMKETKLRENIFADKSINDSTRSNTLFFLEEAKKILTTELKGALERFSGNIYNNDMSLKTSDVIGAGNTFIIDKPSTPFGQSFPSEFYPGIINPLKKRVLKQHLNIDTRFRDNYYTTQSTNFHVDLPIKFSSVMTMQLTTFEMPTAYYAISSQLGNNFFTITIGSESEVITIRDGNYTSDALVMYLNNYVSGTGPLAGTVFSDILFTANIDGSGSGSGQMNINLNSSVVSDATIFNFTVNFQADKYGNPDYSTPLPLKFGWIMGFREGIYTNNSSYVSEGLLDVTGPRYIFLVIDDFNNNVNNSFYSAFNSSILNKNVLARISLQGGTFNILLQNNLSVITNARQYFGPVDIQKLHIKLLDEYGRILDLNNMNYSFCLMFQTVYDL
jgi:hypothetical protein